MLALKALGVHPTFLDLWKVTESIDYHIITMYTKNPDGLRLSTYLHKNRYQRVYEQELTIKEMGNSLGGPHGITIAPWAATMTADPSTQKEILPSFLLRASGLQFSNNLNFWDDMSKGTH